MTIKNDELIAVFTATFNHTFRSSRETIHVMPRDIKKHSITKFDVWKYIMEYNATDFVISYSPLFDDPNTSVDVELGLLSDEP
jgi:hypothetical protein